MDVKVFRTFLELAKVRHFGRAAENLYITQAAVSARIKQLESYFDTQLFIRDRNNIKLTSAGERLIGYAEVMVTTLQQAKLELSLEDGKALQLTMGYAEHLGCLPAKLFECRDGLVWWLRFYGGSHGT